jgi:hypothetical protein
VQPSRPPLPVEFFPVAWVLPFKVFRFFALACDGFCPVLSEAFEHGGLGYSAGVEDDVVGLAGFAARSTTEKTHDIHSFLLTLRASPTRGILCDDESLQVGKKQKNSYDPTLNITK